MAKRVLITENPEPHYNQLSAAEAERLAILAEEASEVVKCCMKILRHGHRHYGTETNRQALERELGDAAHAVDRMAKAGDIDATKILERMQSKPIHIGEFLHHQ